MEAAKQSTTQTEITEVVDVKKPAKKLSINQSTLIFFVATAAIFGVLIYASGQNNKTTMSMQPRPGYMNGGMRDKQRTFDDNNFGAPMGPQTRQHYRTR